MAPLSSHGLLLGLHNQPAHRLHAYVTHRADREPHADTHTLRIPKIYHHGELSTLPEGVQQSVENQGSPPSARGLLYAVLC